MAMTQAVIPRDFAASLAVAAGLWAEPGNGSGSSEDITSAVAPFRVSANLPVY